MEKIFAETYDFLEADNEKLYYLEDEKLFMEALLNGDKQVRINILTFLFYAKALIINGFLNLEKTFEYLLTCRVGRKPTATLKNGGL